MATGDCFFCKKLIDLDRLPREEVICAFPHSVAFLGSWQYYQGYCILASRRHAEEFSQLADLERRGYFEEMCILALAIQKTFHPQKLNYEVLGNQTPHLHWHLFPRHAEDEDRLKPVWLALDKAEENEEIKRRYETGPMPRSETADRLRKTLGELTQHSGGVFFT